jgi:hypothetical protein
VSYLAKNDLDHQTTARTHSDFFAVAEVCQADLKAIATRARVMVDLQGWVESHVFDFDLIVDVELVCHGGAGMEWMRCGSREDAVLMF